MSMNREEFDKWLKSIPDEEKDPFCPFSIGYCDVAYTEECFKCQGKDLDEILNGNE